MIGHIYTAIIDAGLADSKIAFMNDDLTEQTSTTTPLVLQGVDLIRAELATLPQRPGVYRMENAKGDVLWQAPK